MKCRWILSGLMVGILLLSGCSSSLDSITENTMILEKKGSISDISVEDFSGNTYNMEDLRRFVQEEIESYNTGAGAENIVLEELNTDSDQVWLQLSYMGMEDYNSFNGTDYVLSDLADTRISGAFTSAADGSTVKAEDITEADLKVLKIGDAMDIICRGKVLYYNAYVTENSGTFTSSGEGEAILVFR